MFKVITLATSKGRREIHTGPQFCGTAFVTGAFATEIGIVDLHPTGQAFARIPLHHHLHELVFELPGGGLGHPEAATEFEAGDSALALRQVVHGAEAGAQRHLGRGENRADDRDQNLV